MSKYFQRTPFGKAWENAELAVTVGAANGQIDAWGVAEIYRIGLTLRQRLSDVMRDSKGAEHAYLVNALDALNGRMGAQYAFVRDTLGSEVMLSPRSLNELRAEYEAAAQIKTMSKYFQRTPFCKAWKNAELAFATHAANGHLDPWGTAESYRINLTLRERLSDIMRDSTEDEHPYIVDALDALNGHIYAQYTLLRDTLGLEVLDSSRSLDDLRAEYEAAAQSEKDPDAA